jgi:hypothetical protein
MTPDLSYFLFHFYFLKLLPRNELQTKVKNKPYSFFLNKQIGRFSIFKLKALIAAFRFYKKFYKFFKLADPSVRKKKIFLQTFLSDFPLFNKNTPFPGDFPNYQTPLRTLNKPLAASATVPYLLNLRTSGPLNYRKLTPRNHYHFFLTRASTNNRNSVIRGKFDLFSPLIYGASKLRKHFVALVFLQLAARNRPSDTELRCRTGLRVHPRPALYRLISIFSSAFSLNNPNAPFLQITTALTKPLSARNASSTYWMKFRQFRFFFANRLNFTQMRF